MATLEKLSILKAWAQVYIVAMVNNDSSPTSNVIKKLKNNTPNNNAQASANDDDFGDFESHGESLLALVKPELENLSTHWLAALRDYALLSLPPEYSSQLPHDGGAFYTPDTINSSKPHYLTSWPQILYAAALWLNSGGFSITEVENGNACASGTTDDTESNMSSYEKAQIITHGSVSADRFHLMFGICMEALCSTRTNEKLESVISCLKSLYTIFDSNWARNMITKSDGLMIELCNVLYRLILTRDSMEVQLLCIEIVKQTVLAAHESLDSEIKMRLQEFGNLDNQNDDNKTEAEYKKELDELGESEIEPGNSHVYTALEVILCLLARQLPALNPSQSTRLTTEHLQLQMQQNSNGLYKLSDDNHLLISIGIQTMEDLTKLCSPQGI
jgi:hypothetical protein